ncbi:MAG: methylated-DNA--[protein]-cysteine S-methyltransferase [Anaerolineales bacterium]
MRITFYLISSSVFGKFALVWQDSDTGPRLRRVFLTDGKTHIETRIQKQFPGAYLSSASAVRMISEKIQQFLAGEPVKFDLKDIALEWCSSFQVSVLKAESQIPRDWVSTYGRIAHKLGLSSGARAVGGALARNPFPIIIPCHRAIRSNGELGGYQGGVDMKRTLLEYEGIEFSKTGLVVMNSVFY